MSSYVQQEILFRAALLRYTLTPSSGHSEAQPEAHYFHNALNEKGTYQQPGVLSFSHRQDLHEWVSISLLNTLESY